MIQTNIENPVQISWDVKTKYLSDPFLNLLFYIKKMRKITEIIILLRVVEKPTQLSASSSSDSDKDDANAKFLRYNYHLKNSEFQRKTDFRYNSENAI